MTDVVLFSVVIPVFNRSLQLARAIESVLTQTYQNFEIIVVDDGSRESISLEIRRLINDLSDERLRIIRHLLNKNGAAARNTGIKAANGNYICLLDSDDSWHPTKLFKVRELILKQTNGDFVIHHQYRDKAQNTLSCPLPEKAKKKGELVAHYSFVTNIAGGIQSSTICIPKGLALQSLFNESFRGHQDWDFTLKLGSLTDRFIFICEPLSIRYIDSENSVVNSLDWKYSLWFYSQVSQFFSGKAALFYFKKVILSRAKLSANLRVIFLNSLFLRSLFSNPYFCIKCSLQFLFLVVKFRRRLSNFVKSCKKRKVKNVIIWGANSYAKSIINSYKSCSDRIDIIDANASKLNNVYLDLRVDTLQSISSSKLNDADIIVLATDKHAENMKSELYARFPQFMDKVIQF